MNSINRLDCSVYLEAELVNNSTVNYRIPYQLIEKINEIISNLNEITGSKIAKSIINLEKAVKDQENA